MTQQLKLEKTHIRSFFWPDTIFRGLVIFYQSWVVGFGVSGIILYTINMTGSNEWRIYRWWIYIFVFLIISMFMLSFGYRKDILHIIIEKYEYSLMYKLIKYVNRIKYLMYLINIFMLYIIIADPYFIYTNLGINIGALYILSAFVVGVILIFDNPLTKNGIYLIQYTELHKNIDDFIDRQEWLRLICRNIETVLKKGNIWINHDLLLYRINIGIKKEPKKIKDFLKKTEKCFLSEVTKDDLLTYVEEILCESEIILYEPLTIYEKVRRIPFENIKDTLGVLIIFILLIMFPTKSFEFLILIAEKFI